MKELSTFPIVDLFVSIQGEGINVGIPSIFIRVSGCNLRCVFKNSICDTPYSSHVLEKGKFSLNDIQNLIKENPQVMHLVLTGGEPCLYPGLITWLTENYPDHMLTVETNGTVYPGPVANRVDLFSISPKLSSSTPTKEKMDRLGVCLTGWEEKHEKTRENIRALTQLIRAGRCAQLKYVIADPLDFFELQKQILEIENEMGLPLDKSGIYLMPEGDTEEKLKENRQLVAKLAIKKGFCYSDRLQFVIWGNKREA